MPAKTLVLNSREGLESPIISVYGPVWRICKSCPLHLPDQLRYSPDFRRKKRLTLPDKSSMEYTLQWGTQVQALQWIKARKSWMSAHRCNTFIQDLKNPKWMVHTVQKGQTADVLVSGRPGQLSCSQTSWGRCQLNLFFLMVGTLGFSSRFPFLSR